MKRIAVPLSLLTALAAGCSPDDSDFAEGELGTIEVPLTSTGDDGSLYELSGTLTVTGPPGILTFDLAGAEDTFKTAIPPGQYSVELSSFLVSKDGAPLSDAVLVSPNPQSVAIRPRLPATVVFRFVRGGGLVVDFSVDEQAFWFAGEFTVGEDANEDIPALEPTGLFTQYEGVTIGYFILFDNLTSVSYFEKFGLKYHEYVAEGAHLSFDGDPYGVFSGDIAPDLDNNRLTILAIRDPATNATLALATTTTSTYEIDLSQDHSALLCAGYEVLPIDGAGFADLAPFTSGQIAPFPACSVAHTADGGVTYSNGEGRASLEFDWLAPP